jgi:hypothetical protein
LGDKFPKGVNVHKYKLGEHGQYELDPEFPGDNPQEDAGDPNFDSDRAIDESDELTAEEKEQLKRDIAEVKATSINAPNMEKNEDGVYQARVDITGFVDQLDSLTPDEKEELKRGIVKERARQASERRQREVGE